MKFQRFFQCPEIQNNALNDLFFKHLIGLIEIVAFCYKIANW